MGVVQETERARKTRGKKQEIEYNHALLAILRPKRKEMAGEAGVPPYVIFSDRTLVEMAAYFPQSTESLLSISGVGQVKSRQYGNAFLEVIKTYCQKHGSKERPHPRRFSQKEKRAASPSPHGREDRGEEEIGERTRLVAEAYNAGETIHSLMERYHVTTGTILGHLARYLSAGNKLRNGEDLQRLTSATLEQQQAAFAAFDELSLTFLKPVYEKLNEALNYDELKILRLLYMLAQQD
jgi:ATP-dependent DNA helicase RecQ